MKIPKTIQGMSGIASLINQEYGTTLGIFCTRRDIDRWRKGQLVPNGVEPFPAPESDNCYNVAKCRRWVASYIEKKGDSPTIESLEVKAEAVARRERARANREERLDRKEKGDLIERAVAEIDAIGIVQRLHNSCTLQDEQEIPTFCAETLRNLNLQPDTIAVFLAKLTEKMQTITARRVAMFQDSTKEFLKNA